MSTRALPHWEHAHQDYAVREPALRVRQGEAFTLNARSVLGPGRRELPRSYADLVIPVTGPVAVEGVHAGDRIRVDVLAIDIDDEGAMVTLPGYGAFGSSVSVDGRIVPIRNGVAQFGDGIAVPLRAMLGKIAVAVPDSAPASSTVGEFGGNMDNKLLGAGASILLTSRVDEALLYAGDLHACQADGESSLTALEVAGSVTLRVTVAPSLPTQLPVVVTPTSTMVIGSGATLEDAIREALHAMAALLSTVHGWTLETSAMALSLIGDVGVCQLVNPRVSGKVTVENGYLAGLGIAPLASVDPSAASAI